MTETRKLAAILVADNVGYSRLTGAACGAVARSSRRDPRRDARGARRPPPRWRDRPPNACRRRFRRETLRRTLLGRLLRRASQNPAAHFCDTASASQNLRHVTTTCYNRCLLASVPMSLGPRAPAPERGPPGGGQKRSALSSSRTIRPALDLASRSILDAARTWRGYAPFDCGPRFYLFQLNGRAQPPAD